jgi:hypothetical protein
MAGLRSIQFINDGTEASLLNGTVMTISEFSERIEMLQNLVIAVATGGSGDAREYGTLRQEIVDHHMLKDITPRFLRTCRTTDQFWQFIKYEYGSYAERRQFIWDSFRPLFERIEGAAAVPSDQLSFGGKPVTSSGKKRQCGRRRASSLGGIAAGVCRNGARFQT